MKGCCCSRWDRPPVGLRGILRSVRLVLSQRSPLKFGDWIGLLSPGVFRRFGPLPGQTALRSARHRRGLSAIDPRASMGRSHAGTWECEGFAFEPKCSEDDARARARQDDFSLFNDLVGYDVNATPFVHPPIAFPRHFSHPKPSPPARPATNPFISGFYFHHHIRPHRARPSIVGYPGGDLEAVEAVIFLRYKRAALVRIPYWLERAAFWVHVHPERLCP